MNQNLIEDALCDEGVPHCAREFINTGGGVMNLLVHTMLGDDPAGCDYGPEVGIGPFRPDGELEFTAGAIGPEATVFVWDENDPESREDPAECHSLAEVAAAAWAIRNAAEEATR